MTIEERLAEAMHEYSDEIEPEADSWARIESRLELPSARRSSARGLVVAGVALVTVLALVGGWLAVRDTGGDGRVSTAPTKDMPSRILAITKTGQPVVLDTRTGRHEFEYDVNGLVGAQIAVTPGGRDAYVVQGDSPHGCEGKSILRLPVGSRAAPGREVARNATDPTASADGRYLAYLHCRPGDNPAVEIVLRELVSGEERSFAAPSNMFFVSGLQFAPDSRHLAFRLHDERRRADSAHEVDLVGGEQLPGRVLAISSPVFWTGYLGSRDRYLGLLGRDVVSAPAFGRSRALFRLAGPSAAVADLSGRHVLAVDVGRGRGALYRWSEGDKSPTKIADGIVAATWIPDAPRAPAAPRPKEVVALTSKFDLVVMDASTGHLLRTLARDVSVSRGLPALTPTPDGKSVYFTSHLPPDPAGGCVGGIDTVMRVDVAGGIVGSWGRGRAVAISPDGRQLAIAGGGGVGCGDDAGSVEIRNLATGETRTFAGTAVLGDLSWSADGRSLAFLRSNGSSSGAQTYVLDVETASTLSDASCMCDWSDAQGPYGFRGSSGQLVGAEGKRVVAADPVTRRFLPDLVVTDYPVDGPVRSDPTGRHLLFTLLVPEGARTSRGALYRWSEGNRKPTKIADGIVAAAWISNAAPTPAPREDMPRAIVGTRKGELVVMSSATGKVRRRIALPGLDVSVPPSVSQNGRIAYVGRTLGQPGACGAHEVAAVNLTSGAVTIAAHDAAQPAVSPNGNNLAYVSYNGPSDCGRPESLAFTYIGHPALSGRGWTVPERGQQVHAPSWAGDSRHLAFQWDKGSSSAYELDAEAASSLDEARCVCNQSDATGWYGYLGATGDFLGFYGPGAASSEPQRVVALGPDGAMGRTLFSTRAQITALRSDRSGAHVLMTTDRGLYRWSEGDRLPTKLAKGIVAAAWIPDRAPSAPIPPSTRVLAVIGGDHFGILNASNGRASYLPGRYTDIGGVSATADGRTAVFARLAGPGGCRNGNAVTLQPEIDRLDLATGATEIVVGGSFSPVVSSKGIVAYGFKCGGNTLGFTDLATDQNYRVDPLGSSTGEATPSVDTIEPLGWSPDGSTLVYRLRLTGDPPWHYYVGRLWPAVRSADTDVIELAVGPAATAAAYFDPHTFAIAEDTSAGARVRNYDTSNNSFGTELFRLPESIVSLAADPSGRDFLALTYGHVLYRWTLGDARPTKLATGVSAAAWLP